MKGISRRRATDTNDTQVLTSHSPRRIMFIQASRFTFVALDKDRPSVGNWDKSGRDLMFVANT